MLIAMTGFSFELGRQRTRAQQQSIPTMLCIQKRAVSLLLNVVWLAGLRTTTTVCLLSRLAQAPASVKSVTADASGDPAEPPATRTVVVLAKLAHRNRARILDDASAATDPAPTRALSRAHEWREWIEEGAAMSYRAIPDLPD
jgi:hypothetical protein